MGVQFVAQLLPATYQLKTRPFSTRFLLKNKHCSLYSGRFISREDTLKIPLFTKISLPYTFSNNEDSNEKSKMKNPRWERRATIHGWRRLVWFEWQNFYFQQMLALCWHSLLVGQKTDIVFALHIQNLFRGSLGLDKGRRKQRNKRTEARAAASFT